MLDCALQTGRKVDHCICPILFVLCMYDMCDQGAGIRSCNLCIASTDHGKERRACCVGGHTKELCHWDLWQRIDVGIHSSACVEHRIAVQVSSVRSLQTEVSGTDARIKRFLQKLSVLLIIGEMQREVRGFKAHKEWPEAVQRQMAREVQV
jgi:hypothetical protein